MNVTAPGIVAAQPAATTNPTSAGEFHRLLDSLEELVKQHRQLGEVQDPAQLRSAMQTAESGFVTAMDLRRHLEQALRDHLQ